MWNTMRGIFFPSSSSMNTCLQFILRPRFIFGLPQNLLFPALCLARSQETISPIALICHVWLSKQQKETAGGTYRSWVLSEQQLSLHLSKPLHIHYIVISQHQTSSLHTTTYFLLGLIWGLRILFGLLILLNSLCNCDEEQGTWTQYFWFFGYEILRLKIGHNLNKFPVLTWNNSR